MKFHRLILAAACLATLNTGLRADDAQAPATETEALTMEDLTATAKLDSGEIETDDRFGQYTEEEVETFLNQYVGVWEGYYDIQTISGQILTHMDARSTYEWDLVGKTRVLKNQSVFAAGDKIAYSSSLTYFWFGRVVTEVEQDGVKRIFLGYLAPDGKSITWNVANAIKKLSSSTKENFVESNGRRAIQIEAFEEVRNGTATATIVMKGELKQVDPE